MYFDYMQIIFQAALIHYIYFKTFSFLLDLYSQWPPFVEKKQALAKMSEEILPCVSLNGHNFLEN